MPFLTINHHPLYYDDHGDPHAPAVVLLHHGLGSTYSWKEQVGALARAGWRVVAYDRWGYGQSSGRPALDLPEFTDDLDDLEALLDALQIERAALVGHSDGGTIAICYAARRPERVTALVTIAAHIYVEAKMQPAIHAIRAQYDGDPRLRGALGRLHGPKVDTLFQSWFDAWVQPAALEWDLRPMLGCIRCPALIVQGMEDEHATPQHAEDIAAGIPGAKLWLVAGGGHMLPQDEPGRLNVELVKFLQNRSGRA